MKRKSSPVKRKKVAKRGPKPIGDQISIAVTPEQLKWIDSQTEAGVATRAQVVRRCIQETMERDK
jgi:adenosylcobinamide amidohydrolase